MQKVECQKNWAKLKSPFPQLHSIHIVQDLKGIHIMTRWLVTCKHRQPRQYTSNLQVNLTNYTCSSYLHFSFSAISCKYSQSHAIPKQKMTLVLIYLFHTLTSGNILTIISTGNIPHSSLYVISTQI